MVPPPQSSSGWLSTVRHLSDASVVEHRAGVVVARLCLERRVNVLDSC